MTDAEILAKVKIGMGITTDYQDNLLQIYIDDVKAFMTSAGVSANVLTSAASVGCIIRGVIDLWNYSSGDTKFSETFKLRVSQLALESQVSN